MSADERTRDAPALVDTLGLDAPTVTTERGGAGTVIGVDAERVRVAAFVADDAAPTDLQAAQFALEGEALRHLNGGER